MNYFYGLKHPIYTIILTSLVFTLAYGNHTLAASGTAGAADTAAPYVQAAE
jgi:hypothetical protein